MGWNRMAGALLISLGLVAWAGAQTRSGDAALKPVDDPTLTAAVRELSGQVAELRATVAELRDATMRDREEIARLRQQLQSALPVIPQDAGLKPATAAPPTTKQSSNDHRIQRLEDAYDLLSGKVNDQYQTKVESGSKYRVRLSGIMLFNLFSNNGTADSADVPFIATPALNGDVGGSFGGTVRQSQVRFEVFGPKVAGARTHGDMTMDFAGGFPGTENGAALGLARLRTATLHFDWANSSLVAGQDVPFFSPLSPTSLATLAQPSLSYAGNLWTWIPQVRLTHRIATGEASHLSVEGGLLDPLSGEVPPLEFDRVPQAGEGSRQPAVATRIGWSSSQSDRAASFGVGGFYSRQNWRFDRNVDAWITSADWSVPLGTPFTLSGEFYRGRGTGGLGGGIGRSVLFFGPEAQPGSAVRGLDSVGGWTQVKYQFNPRLEFNVALGQDNPFAGEFRQAAIGTNILDREAVRNRSAVINFIYRPKSNLLLSSEYRRINTYRVDSSSRSADHLDLAIGVLF